jgi:hypothetical protein
VADIFVTAETKQIEGGLWEAAAYAEQVWRAEDATEQAAQDAFIAMWNLTHETTYLPENFDFVSQA